ncbi:MAG: hypothetical protein HRU03_02050 [Nanoarchaeales archaeon]|nr:hypothetical protein [Nanoarchaeales archaeon]
MKYMSILGLNKRKIGVEVSTTPNLMKLLGMLPLNSKTQVIKPIDIPYSESHIHIYHQIKNNQIKNLDIETRDHQNLQKAIQVFIYYKFNSKLPNEYFLGEFNTSPVVVTYNPKFDDEVTEEKIFNWSQEYKPKTQQQYNIVKF